MNVLPEHRRAIYGRTWPQSWSPAAMDPIERYTVPRFDRYAGLALAIFIGISGGFLLAAFLGG